MSGTMTLCSEGMFRHIWTGPIRCDICCTSCIYHGVELIGMNYDDFMKLQIDVPDNLMPLYMMEANGQGHTEEIVCCYNAGLKIWFDDETGPIVNIFIVNSFEDDIYGPEE